MSEICTLEVEEELKEVKNNETKINRRIRNDLNSQLQLKRIKKTLLQVTKPSYTLRESYGKVRELNRRILRRLLRRLVRRYNWEEASGVLSILLKGTGTESSPIRNREKYWVSMELRRHIKSDPINLNKLKHVFHLWMKRIGSMKNWPVEDRFAVQSEFILFCLRQGNVEDASQAAEGLMQDGKFGNDPISIMVVGLTFCQLWFSTIPEEFLLRHSDNCYSPNQSEFSEMLFNVPNENSEEHEAVDMHESLSSLKADSDTSVRNDKDIAKDIGSGQLREGSMEVDDALQRETTYQNYQSQGFYMNSPADSGHENSSFAYHVDDMQYGSILNVQGLESWLLPLRFRHSDENLKDFLYSHQENLNDYYKGAIRHLRLALYSTPPIYDALLPLVQMLLLGDNIQGALNELEKFGHLSGGAPPIRVKASLLEHFDSANSVTLSTCFEDILKIDPQCSHSLAKLITLHKNGEYGPERLLEMIALHLDATYPQCSTWKEFASCFLKVSKHDEDRMSMCANGNGENKRGYSIHFNRIPPMFTGGVSGKDWRLRCRCWLRRHFSRNILSSEIETGELDLLSYKAASACYIYGREFEYVVKAYSLLEDKDGDLFSFLEMHVRSSIGFYLNFAIK